MRSYLLISIPLLIAGSIIAAVPPIDQQAVIPFEFHVGKAVLSSGSYQVSADAGTGVIQVHGLSNGMRATTASFVSERGVGFSRVSQLVFNRYGKVYFLSGFCCDLVDSGRTVLQSREEREMSTRIPTQSETLELGRRARD
jgi:hypothetical protein